MQEMISVDNSKAAVGLLGMRLQLTYIEQCILLEHVEDGMTIEDLVASLKSSASHEAKSIAKRIEALSEELNGSGEQDMANDEKARRAKMPDTERKSMVDADIEAVKQNVIMGISCTKHPGEDAWEPTITAARLLEKAEKALLRDADAYFAQRAAQEALSLLKANEQQIEQLHTLLEHDEKRRETARRLRDAADKADPALGVPETEIFCILDVDLGGARGFADMQDVLSLADLIDLPARQDNER